MKTSPQSTKVEALARHLFTLTNQRRLEQGKIDGLVQLILAFDLTKSIYEKKGMPENESRLFYLAQAACYGWNHDIQDELVQDSAFQSLLKLPFFDKFVLMGGVEVHLLPCREKQYLCFVPSASRA